MTKKIKQTSHRLIEGSGNKLAARIRKHNGYGSDFKKHPWGIAGLIVINVDLKPTI